MHHALRSSLAVLAIATIAANTGCETHDRRIYTTHRDKNLHTPNPWAPSTTKAADDATAALGMPSAPGETGVPSAPVTPVMPAPPVNR